MLHADYAEEKAMKLFLKGERCYSPKCGYRKKKLRARTAWTEQQKESL